MIGVCTTIDRPPSLRDVTAMVRECNRHFDGPAPVSLVFTESGRWTVRVFDPHVMLLDVEAFGFEHIPGDDAPIDAVAVARRLLAAYRDAPAEDKVDTSGGGDEW